MKAEEECKTLDPILLLNVSALAMITISRGVAHSLPTQLGQLLRSFRSGSKFRCGGGDIGVTSAFLGLLRIATFEFHQHRDDFRISDSGGS